VIVINFFVPYLIFIYLAMNMVYCVK